MPNHMDVRGSENNKSNQVTVKTNLVTREELAHYLKISTRSVSRYQAEGKISPVYIGPRTVRYDLRECYQALTGKQLGANDFVERTTIN